MRLRAKKLAQGAILVCFGLCYAALLVIWVTSTTNEAILPNLANDGQQSNHHNSDDFLSFQERVPRSVIDNKIDSEKPSFKPLIYSNNHKESHEISSHISNNSDLANNSKVNTNKNRHKINHKNRYPLTTLNDIFISVKTTKNFHSTRLNVILQTWFTLAKDQTFFFTDAEDSLYNEKSGGHLINTNCSSSHNRKALCCKMSVEFDTFIESNKRWFCHFDDDNYVNVPQLVQLLRQFNPLEDWYLGKPSIRQPLEILNRDNIHEKIAFWFATGGAGFCLSRALALKMMPTASGGKFISIGEKIRLPDDVTLGYIVEHLLSKRLTVIEKFHSHLEPMKFLKLDSLSKQITFSYSRYGQEMNVLSIDGGFDIRKDPTRFLSLHCHLFPNFNYCQT